MKKTAMLLIMDGFGLAPEGPGNAITSAETPNLDRLMKEYPHTRLFASGKAVGLPEGQMGNSEDRKSTRLNSSHPTTSRMPSSA